MPSHDNDTALANALAERVIPLDGSRADRAALDEIIGDATIVQIGEATHGTHEFYRLRAELTQHLVTERGFTAIAVEGDWPDCHRVNRWVRGESDDHDASTALADFRRFPAWMWRNTDVQHFLEWLRAHNETMAPEKRAGFYGLDLYSLHSSIDAVLAYLERTDPEAAARARYRYGCFDHFGFDPQRYGQLTTMGLRASCEDEVIAQLVEMQRNVTASGAAALSAFDAQLEATQNARVVKDAEAYYRAMFHGRVSSWNLRDTHMAETLDGLLRHFTVSGRAPKIVVWAHNSHVGDARATQMGDEGEHTLGQLTRQQYGDRVRLIGFSTYKGSVTAASEWGAAAERKTVRDGLPGSYEALFHEVGIDRFVLDLRDLGEATGALREARLQRAIGVLYLPQTERRSHYYEARLPDEFDAIIHLDQTSALEPLERNAGWERGELPDTYPTGV